MEIEKFNFFLYLQTADLKNSLILIIQYLSPMQFVQNLSRNCCLSDVKSPSKLFANNPQPITPHLKSLNRITSKKSLKEYANMKATKNKQIPIVS